MDKDLLTELDRLVNARIFRSRSQAVQLAVKEKIDRLAKTRLARECLKLDKDEEQALAEEGLTTELSGWPDY